MLFTLCCLQCCYNSLQLHTFTTCFSCKHVEDVQKVGELPTETGCKHMELQGDVTALHVTEGKFLVHLRFAPCEPKIPPPTYQPVENLIQNTVPTFICGTMLFHITLMALAREEFLLSTGNNAHASG